MTREPLPGLKVAPDDLPELIVYNMLTRAAGVEHERRRLKDDPMPMAVLNLVDTLQGFLRKRAEAQGYDLR